MAERMKLEIGKEMDPGGRKRFEDRWAYKEFPIPGEAGKSMVVAIVADGVGGENAGERAAQIAVDTVLSHCKTYITEEPTRLIRDALEAANRAVYEEAQRSSRFENMGTTAAVVILKRNRLYVGNVGDSRVYLIRDGGLIQLTVDHIFAHDMVRSGKLTQEEAYSHPKRNQITRSLGYSLALEVDLGVYLRGDEMELEAAGNQGLHLKPGDGIVLCTDGVYRFVEEGQMSSDVQRYSAQKAAMMLVSRALGNNTDDNATAIVVQVPGVSMSRRWLWVPVGLSAMAVIGVMLGWMLVRAFIPGSTPTPTVPAGQVRVLRLEGTVQIRDIERENWQAIDREALIREGQLVQVMAEGLGQVDFHGGSVVWLDSSTLAEVMRVGSTEVGDLPSLGLQQGRVCVRTAANGGGEEVFRVTTPLGFATLDELSVAGIEYSPAQNRVRLICLDGTCCLRNGENEHRILMTGQVSILEGEAEIPTFPETLTHEQEAAWGSLCSMEFPREETPESTPGENVPTPTLYGSNLSPSDRFYNLHQHKWQVGTRRALTASIPLTFLLFVWLSNQGVKTYRSRSLKRNGKDTLVNCVVNERVPYTRR